MRQMPGRIRRVWGACGRRRRTVVGRVGAPPCRMGAVPECVDCDGRGIRGRPEHAGRRSRGRGTGRPNGGTALGNGAAAPKLAFRDAAEQAQHSAAEQNLAARAHARAGDAKLGAAVRGQADMPLEAGQAAAKWASMADLDMGVAKKAQRQWEECADRRAHGGAYPGDRAEWVDEQARMLADAEYGRAKWTGKAERAGKTARTAADGLRQCAEPAGRIATAAGLPGDIPPGAQGAARARRAAMRPARMQAGRAVGAARRAAAAADRPCDGREHRPA